MADLFSSLYPQQAASSAAFRIAALDSPSRITPADRCAASGLLQNVIISALLHSLICHVLQPRPRLYGLAGQNIDI